MSKSEAKNFLGGLELPVGKNQDLKPDPNISSRGHHFLPREPEFSAFC